MVPTFVKLESRWVCRDSSWRATDDSAFQRQLSDERLTIHETRLTEDDYQLVVVFEEEGEPIKVHERHGRVPERAVEEALKGLNIYDRFSIVKSRR